MALPSQTVHLAAGQPINESVRLELADAGTSNRSNVNARFHTLQSIGRRLGFGALTRTRLDATTRTVGARMFERNGAPCVLDATTLDEYSEQCSANINHTRIPECAASSLPISTRVSSTSDSLTDIAYANGYFAVSQQNNITGYITVVDVNGVTIRAPELVVAVNDVNVGLGSYGVYLIAVGTSTSSVNVPAYYLDTTSRATIATGWVSIGNIATDHHTGGGLGNPDNYWDVQSLSDRIAIVYRNTSAGTNRLAVVTFNITGALQATTINTSSVTPDGASLFATATSALWVVWNEGTSVKILGLNQGTISSITSTVGNLITLDATGVDAIGVVWFDGSAQGRIVVSEAAQDRCQIRSFNTTAGATTGVGSTVRVPVAQLVGKPFVYNARAYAVFDACSKTNIEPLGPRQGLCVLCDFTADNTWIRPVAMTDPYLAIPPIFRNAHVVAQTSTKLVTAVAVRASVDCLAVKLVTYDFASDVKRAVTSHSGFTYLGDGLASTFDGVVCTEAGFVQRPPALSLNSGSAGALSGTYSYVATYQTTDADGRLVQSSVSDAVNSGAIVSKTVAVTFRPCAITSRQITSYGGEVSIVLWRSDNGGPFYKVTTQRNITANAFTTYNDNASSLISQPLLMGTGNLPGTGAQQDRRHPGALSNLVSYNGMIVGSRGSSLLYSSQDIDGEEPWFNPIFTVNIPETVIAQAAMDGTLYIFGRRNIYAASGDAPSDNGASGGLGTPRRIATDVGCIDSGSVCVTGLGIFFQSDRGIEILSRDGSVSWIGEPVQETTASFPKVTSAVLDARNALVRITLAATRTNGIVGTSGASVIFDLTTRSWVSKDLIRGQLASEAAQDACMVRIANVWRYAWLGADGYVYLEKLESDSDAYLDGASWVDLTYEMPPLKMGLLQEQRIWEMEVLFERHSAAGLKVEIAKDYGAYSVEPDKVWTATDIASERIVPLTPKAYGWAMQLRVSDQAPAPLTGSGRGLTFIGISSDMAPKKGPQRGTPRLKASLRR